MLAERTFNIIKVAAGKGTELGAVKKFDKVVTYDGKKVVVNL